MHTNSLILFDRYVLPLVENGMILLEVGPCKRKQHYRDLLVSRGREFSYHFTDLANYHASRSGFVRATGEYHYKAPDAFYDVVMSGQVIEHVRKPWMWVKELARLAKPGGLVAIIGPITTVYHPAPVDCWRIYPDGMRALFEDAGLQEVVIAMEADDDTHKGRELQIGGVASLDIVAIGRKP